MCIHSHNHSHTPRPTVHDLWFMVWHKTILFRCNIINVLPPILLITMRSTNFVTWLIKLIVRSSTSSCHQTFRFHCSVHGYPISLNLRRSSNVQGCVKREHRNICSVFSSSSPHAHVVYHWSSPISSSARYCKCIQCGVCLGIAMWARGYHTPWLVLHSSWPCPITTCPLTFSATRYIVRLLQGSRMVSHLSGSSFLTSVGHVSGCDQIGNECLVLSVWFHSSTYISPDVWRRNSR